MGVIPFLIGVTVAALLPAGSAFAGPAKMVSGLRSQRTTRRPFSFGQGSAGLEAAFRQSLWF
jgi:hypothetical protein